MKIRNIILMTALVAAAACKDERTETPEDDYTEIVVKVPGTSLPSTYAMSEADENKIETIDVLTFEQDGAGEVFRYRGKGENIVNRQGAVSGNKKTFKVKLRKSSRKQRLVVLANARQYINLTPADIGKSKEDVLGAFTFPFTGKWAVDGSAPFPMWGESGLVVVGTDAIGEINLLRALVRLDIGVDIGNQDPALGFGYYFKILHVTVVNAKNRAYVAPNSKAGYANDRVTAPSVPSVAADADTIGFAMPERTLYREIYLPESNATNTFLVIKAKYYGTTYYYRLDIAEVTGVKSQHLPLLRNHLYLINITGIRTEGFARFNEAKTNTGSNLMMGLTVINEAINDISFNDQYMLGLSHDHLVVDAYKAEYKVPVTTSYARGWQATVTQGAPWLTLKSASGASGDAMLTFAVDRNIDVFSRTGIVTLTAGQISKKFTVVQYIGANCYIVAPGGKVDIPVAMANADGTQRVTDKTNMNYCIVWMDVNPPSDLLSNIAVTGSGRSAFISITAGTKQGNACVGLMDNNYQILWSWHVWVTDYLPDDERRQIGVWHNNKQRGYQFMSRNLGASTDVVSDQGSYGMFYQWGRKDPFPGPRTVYGYATAIYTVADDNVFDRTVGHPDWFYVSAKGEWYGLTKQDFLLWRSDAKRPYDPSPIGWRVPGADVFQGGNVPATIASLLNLPVAGGIDAVSGKYGNPGSHTGIWTSTPTIQGNRYFDHTQPAQITSATGGCALPVRCIKE
ncbi:MAG: hypothetical protein LBR08_08380 [Bacteroidales bacterium]|nr:hypothetical protein [Bacteroidales bacterium]